MNVACGRVTYKNWCAAYYCPNILCKAALNVYVDDFIGTKSKVSDTFAAIKCCECGRKGWIEIFDYAMWRYIKYRTRFTWFGLRKNTLESINHEDCKD